MIRQIGLLGMSCIRFLANHGICTISFFNRLFNHLAYARAAKRHVFGTKDGCSAFWASMDLTRYPGREFCFAIVTPRQHIFCYYGYFSHVCHMDNHAKYLC